MSNYKTSKDSRSKGSNGKRRSNNNRSTNSAKDAHTNVSKSEMKVAAEINDASFYFDTDSVDTRELFNFSFNQFAGVDFEVGRTHNNKPYVAEIANIMAVRLNPSPGIVKDGAAMTAGVNQAGLRNFIKLSSNNAKTTQYAPQDVTMLILALGEVASMISWGTRAFGLSKVVNQRNRSYPHLAVEISGFEAEDFIKNMAQYRVRFNLLIRTANKIPFYDGINYITKCSKLYTDFYIDDSSSMAQAYMFSPFSTWVLNEAYNEQGSGLETRRVWSSDTTKHNAIKFSDFLDLLDEQLNALLGSATLNYIYSDVLRIIGDGNRLSFAMVPEDYVVSPAVISEQSAWLHNMTVLSTPLATADQKAVVGYTFTPTNDVLSDVNNNAIKYQPQFNFLSGIRNTSTIVDFRTMDPSIQDKTDATRLSVTCDAVYDATKGYYTTNIALPDHYAVIVQCVAGTTGYIAANQLSFPTGSIAQNWGTIDYMSKFHNGPLVYVTNESADDGLVSIIGELNYYTTLPHNTLAAIHTASFLNLFNI